MGKEKKPRGKVKLGSMNHHSSWVPPPPPRLGTAGAGSSAGPRMQQTPSLTVPQLINVVSYDPF